jgi:AcrR family transcriptional regulator
MSPRPRKVSDDEIFAAVTRVMSRMGPSQLTLADIAAEAGLTAGALVQRFGSKRALMLTLMSRFAESVPAMFEQLRSAHRSPVDTILAYAECIARMGESPGALAHHLAYLQVDLTDPDFHRHTLAQARASRAALRTLLDDAIAAGELVGRDGEPIDTDALARALEVTVNGSLMTWAFHQEGSATSWMRDDVNALLRPFMATATRGGTLEQGASTQGL